MSKTNSMMRRTWLLSPLAVIAPAKTSTVAVYRKENVLGTTLELQVAGPGGDAAFQACLDEVERLRAILSTYDPASEISRWIEQGEKEEAPAEVRQLLGLYHMWALRSGGAISSRLNGRLDVNALGKSFIVEKGIEAARRAAPGGVLLNIGGDIAVRGGAWSVGLADPLRWHENADALSWIEMDSGAVTTSGSYERGAQHLIDPRTGKTAEGALSATVRAKDAVTANALSTALCVLSAAEGRRLVESTMGAECLVVDRNGESWRSSGFSRIEKQLPLRTASAALWPKGQQVTVTLTLRAIEGYRVRRPYVAVWAEDMSGKVVRNITVWTERRRWLPDLFDWWKKTGSAGGGASVTRATRPPGRYQLLWDGTDDAGQPVGEGKYRIVVESNREHGSYAKESAVIECGAAPSKVMTKETGEFEAVEISYGPGAQAA